MKKYKYFLIIIITFLVSMASFDYFFYDIRLAISNLYKPEPLALDKNNKISVLFENKLFVDGTEIQSMPLSSIVGEKDFGHGLMQIGTEWVVIAVKTYKTHDCEKGEIYAEFKLGQRTRDRKVVFHAVASAKIKNRIKQTITFKTSDPGADLTISTIAYFGPAKQVAGYKPMPFNSAHASLSIEPSVYMITYRFIDNNSAETKRGAIVIKEDQVGNITTTTQLSPELSDSLSYDMKVSRDGEGKHQLDLYSVHKLGAEEERMIVSEIVNIDESNYFFDGRLEVKVSQYKPN